MYILAATFRGVVGPQYFVAKTRKALKPIIADAADWRLNDGDGWINSKSPDSWKTFTEPLAGQMLRYVI